MAAVDFEVVDSFATLAFGLSGQRSGAIDRANLLIDPQFPLPRHICISVV